MTLNLVKAERDKEREGGNICHKWTTIYSHCFHSLFHTLLDFIQKGLTWTNVSPQKNLCSCFHSMGWLFERPSMLIHVLHCTNLLSITTKLPKKHPQRKVKLCHQFPLQNSPQLGKSEGSVSSVLNYLSCVHMKRGLSFWTTTKPKTRVENMRGREGNVMWCFQLFMHSLNVL